jgi:CTP synthase
MSTKQRLRIEWIEASSLIASDEDEQGSYANSWERLKQCDGCVVPGGFGARGMEGKISTIEYCRETGKPFLGELHLLWAGYRRCYLAFGH